MRVAIGAMKHESNTFTRLTTGRDAFSPVTGEAVFDSEWAAGSATAGIIDTLESEGHEIEPTLFAHALPSGVVTADARREMHEGILDGVRSAAPDAVCLDLHGSMYAADEDDPEGALLSELREVVGPDVPIVTSLDMHATVTQRMVDALDGVAAYRTAPHTDVYDSGVRAASVLKRILDGTETAVERVRLPMLVCGEQSETDSEPMEGLIRKLGRVDAREGVLESAYLLGFPWADSPHSGCFAVVTGAASKDGAVAAAADELATAFWERRDEFDFTTEAYPLSAAIDEALSTEGRPVIVSDSGDNPTAGATEDLTIVDQHLREREVDDALVAVVADADAHETCTTAGEGATVDLELGRTEHAPDAPSLAVQASVETLTTVRGVGAAVIEAEGVRTIVTDQRTAVYDPTFLEELGEDPRSTDIVVVKSGYQSPAYQDLAARSMLALTPGDTSLDFESLPYERTPRPIYPLDRPMEWEPEAR